MSVAPNLESKSDTPDLKLMNSSKDWALRLFNKSPLKQRKLKMIKAFLPDLKDVSCLDLGSDNGVISLLLRQQGGGWHSADLNLTTVEAIKSLVGTNVSQFDGINSSFPDNYFDVVVIVDFLEHIVNDRDCMLELYRIMKPGAQLIVNVPNPKEGLIRKLRYALGQTDEVHGHLRPGYNVNELQIIADGKFYFQEFRSYGRLFSELTDTIITAGVYALKGRKHSSKGAVVTGGDLNKLKKSFKLYSILYPILSLVVKLDYLIPFMHGNMLIAKARCLKPVS